MYTNINTDHAIDMIGSWLDSLEERERLPDGFPIDDVKEAMTLVMRNNLFELGYCYFLQLLEPAMGTSAACISSHTTAATYSPPKIQFKHNTLSFGILQWEFVETSSSVTFLDQTISIENGAVVIKIYQKAMNLYQYIPPTPAHPPGMMKGIIYGLMRNYYLQNW
ncbi:hypothetical protein ACHAWF_003108, partial [Thalassiosira exigua]